MAAIDNVCIEDRMKALSESGFDAFLDALFHNITYSNGNIEDLKRSIKIKMIHSPVEDLKSFFEAVRAVINPFSERQLV